MKLPGLLPLKPVQYGIGIVAIVGALALWWNGYKGRIEERAVLQSQIKETEIALDSSKAASQAKDDTLKVVRDSVDLIKEAVTGATSNYTRQRASVNTSIPQPPGVPASMIVVPRSFVQAADSLARLVPDLLNTIRVERELSERRIAAGNATIALLETQNAQLRLAVEAAKPGITGRLKDVGIGVGIGLAVIQLLARN